MTSAEPATCGSVRALDATLHDDAPGRYATALRAAFGGAQLGILPADAVPPRIAMAMARLAAGPTR